MRPHIDPVHPDASSTVTFTVTDDGVYPLTSLPREALDINIADQKYRAIIDRQSMATVKGRFSFKLYVTPNSGLQKSVYVYEVGEDTVDTFNDVEKSANFRFGLEPNSTLGTGTIPIHSPFGPLNALIYKDKDGKISTPPLQSVSIGGGVPFSINLDNQLTDMRATLGPPSVVADCSGCWKLPPTVSISPQDNMNPGDRVTVSFVLSASTFQAMKASAKQIASDKSNDTLRLFIPVTAEAGTTRLQVFAVPIRFTPPLFEMIITVFLGACLGGALRMYFSAAKISTGNATSGQDAGNKTRLFLTGLILALLCEALAVLLFRQTSTEVRLVGVSLDPTQLAPAFLLCILVGGGAAVVTAIKEALGLGGRI